MTAPSADDGSVRVTLKDVYTIVQQTSESVATLVERGTNNGSRLEDHETRLRAVEQKVWALPSLAGLLALAGLILTLYSLVR